MSARSRRPRTLAAGLAFGACLAARGVRAEEAPRITLAWQAPADCPDRAALLARVAQLSSPRASGADASSLDVRALVTLLSDGRFRVELRMVQGGSERTRVLDAPTCAGLAEASAVVMALAAAPGSDEAMPLAMPPLEGTAEPPPVATPRPDASPPVDDRRRGSPPSPAPELRVHASAGIATDFGATADGALGAALLAGIDYGRFASFALRGSFFPSQASTVPGFPNRGVELLLVGAAPLACLAPFELPLELGACAEFELGRFHASGFGAPLHHATWAWWLAPGAGLTAAFPAHGRFRSRLSADALFPLARTDFYLGNVGVAHRLPAVAPRVALYLEVAFR
ncbi:MAG TPA: hypothetical protein VMI54_04595 [Polyangiaceae bacterium]|nr:hypothetical protein [Polyangiaceae bacterium]